MWMGGFTFYAEIVIPTAAHVLGGERQVGFVTEQVTGWLNLIGIAALSVFLWNLIAEWSGQPTTRRRGLAVLWAVMALCHGGLYIIHPLIDALLNPGAHTIHDYDRFLTLHNVYLGFATVQWCAALSYMWLSMRAWQLDDRQTSFNLNAGSESRAESNAPAQSSIGS